MIKIVIFDLWNTLAKKSFSTSAALAGYFNIEKASGFRPRYEHAIQLNRWGSIDDLASGFLESFNLEPSKENKSYVMNTFQKGVKSASPFDGIERVLCGLKKDYRLALLSNTNEFEVLGWNLEKYFDLIIYSYDTGVLKPSKESFDHVFNYFRAMPRECLLVDDSQENINAAKSYGMNALLYRGVGCLEKELLSFQKKVTVRD